MLRVLPKAFLYEYAGSVGNGAGRLERYTFTPNPKFSSIDLELLVLTAMSGHIDRRSCAAKESCAWQVTCSRTLRLDGDILARLYKGGWLIIEQADVGGGHWRIVRFQMGMHGRVFFKTRSFDTTEEETQFAPVPVGMTYQQAIELLRSKAGSEAQAGTGQRR